MTDNNFCIFKRNLDDNKKIFMTESISKAKSQQKKAEYVESRKYEWVLDQYDIKS